ncbi:MAG: signal transduction histidine kinase [Rhodospirillales bacterium]|nr:signal transduction histidine kinase [Rhodospirillales bacterium]
MVAGNGRVLSASAILDAQSEIIDAIAAGTELRRTLRRVALIIERLTPPALCSIHLLDPDGLHLRHGGAPSLPDSFNDFIDGAEIGLHAGSCGTAAFLRERMIVKDIASDPLWADFRAEALPLGLRACWSQPIVDEAGTVLGTLALYYREPRSPCDADLELVDRMARLVRVALVQDRKEKVLIETEQKLRDYLAVSSDWLWEQDTERRLIYLSSDVLGMDAASLVGKAGWDTVVETISPDQIEIYDADIAAERPFRGLRMQQVGATGDIHYLNVGGKPIYDADGKFRGYRGTAHDTSAQVAAEAESLRSKLLAEDANRAKTEFLANISHELRTPLNAILGFSEIMEGALLGPLSERYQQYAADIHTSGQYLHRLVTNILDLSRIEMGRVELDEETVEISELIESSINMLKMRADEGAVRLEVTPVPDLPPVRCDRLRLQQSLINLVTNAVKFTQRYGCVTVSATMMDDGLALRVSDTGIGMRPEDIPRALEAFRQIEPQLNRRHDGVGLGLALTKSLVELHGGRLELISALGKGTTATIHLPAARIVNQSG